MDPAARRRAGRAGAGVGQAAQLGQRAAAAPGFAQARLDLERQGILLKYHYNQLFRAGFGGQLRPRRRRGGRLRVQPGVPPINRGNRPFYSYGAQLTFPLGNSSARAAYKSKLEKEQLLLALKRLEQDIMVAIDNDINRAVSYQQVAATRAAREYAQAALEAEQIKSQAGSSILYLVLQMQRDLTAARGNGNPGPGRLQQTLTQLSLDGNHPRAAGHHLELK